jgi:hypothetical protein
MSLQRVLSSEQAEQRERDLEGKLAVKTDDLGALKRDLDQVCPPYFFLLFITLKPRVE